MIQACREYLKTCINQAGIKTVHTRRVDASKHQAVPYGEIIFGDTDLHRDGSLVARYEGPGEHERTFRRRIYQRIELARIKVVHRDQALAEVTRDAILNSLGSRIQDGNGNAVLITAWSGEPEEDTSILRQEAAAYIDIRFEGGIYRDRTVKLYKTETDLLMEGENKEA